MKSSQHLNLKQCPWMTWSDLCNIFCTVYFADDGVRQYSTIVYRHNILDGRACLLSQSIDCRFQIQMRILVGVCVISQK